MIDIPDDVKPAHKAPVKNLRDAFIRTRRYGIAGDIRIATSPCGMAALKRLFSPRQKFVLYRNAGDLSVVTKHCKSLLVFSDIGQEHRISSDQIAIIKHFIANNIPCKWLRIDWLTGRAIDRFSLDRECGFYCLRPNDDATPFQPIIND